MDTDSRVKYINSLKISPRVICRLHSDPVSADPEVRCLGRTSLASYKESSSASLSTVYPQLFCASTKASTVRIGLRYQIHKEANSSATWITTANLPRTNEMGRSDPPARPC